MSLDLSSAKTKRLAPEVLAGVRLMVEIHYSHEIAKPISSQIPERTPNLLISRDTTLFHQPKNNGTRHPTS